jgi:hypothetical protein
VVLLVRAVPMVASFRNTVQRDHDPKHRSFRKLIPDDFRGIDVNQSSKLRR